MRRSAHPRLDDGLLRRRVLLGDRPAAAPLRLRVRAERGPGRILQGSYAAGTLSRHYRPGCWWRGSARGRPCSAASPFSASPGSPSASAIVVAPRRRAVHPGDGGSDDLVGRVRLADRRVPAGAARGGDRHRGRHRGRRRPLRAAAGRVAAQVGTKPVFGTVARWSPCCWRSPRRAPRRWGSARSRTCAARSRHHHPSDRLATAFVAAPSLMAGAIEVLVPLRIDDFGGSSTVIAGGFVVGAAIEATLAPIAGRYSDRAGRRIPLVGGIVACAVAMVAIAVAQGLGVVLGGLFLVSFGCGLSFTPAIDVALGGGGNRPSCTRASQPACRTSLGRPARSSAPWSAAASPAPSGSRRRTLPSPRCSPAPRSTPAGHWAADTLRR